MRAVTVMLLCGGLMAFPAMAEEVAAGVRIFSSMDADKNGQVSEDEYVTAAANRARKHFQRVDGNADGLLTLDEFKDAGKRIGRMVKERRQQR